MDKLTFSQSVDNIKGKLAPLEEHREDIWKCVKYILDNNEMKKIFKVHLLKGELVIPAERTVLSLVNAVKDAVIKGDVVKGDIGKLDTIRGAQIPLREIKVISADGEQHIEFIFTDLGRTHQGTKFWFVVENGSVNTEKSGHGRFALSGESSGY